MAKDDYQFGCLMLDLSIAGWDALTGFIPEADLYQPGNPMYGRQAAPHCTVLYGFHHAPGLGEELLASLPVDRPRLSAGGVIATGCGIFENVNYDVVKLNLKSVELDRLNRWCKEHYAFTSSFPDYHPHATLAYVKPGKGAAYATSQLLRAELRPISWSYSASGSRGNNLVQPI